MLKPIPGDFSGLASYEVPHSVAESISEMLGLRSAHSIGITDGTHTLGNIQIYTGADEAVPEAHLVEYFANHCYSVLTGIRREQDLTETNTRLNQLIDSMVEGLALHEIILDEDGRPSDYRFIEVNPAFEAMTGLCADDLIGRTVREVLPGTEQVWIDRYGAVAMTGISSSFEDYSSVLDRYYSVVAYSPTPYYFATVVTDITDKKLAESELAQKTGQLEALLAEREETLVRLSNFLTSIVNILSGVTEERDPYTAGHQRRVAMLAVAIASKVGMSAEEIEEVRIASLLHDIGKLSVPTEILTKPGKLTPLEFELIRTHSQRGYDIISSANLDNSIAEIVYQHHERCDGTGYPRGLSADEISPAAKVVMVADVVEAMVSHRPYRAGLGIAPALAEIERGAGSKYDDGVSRACLSCFRDEGFNFSD